MEYLLLFFLELTSKIVFSIATFLSFPDIEIGQASYSSSISGLSSFSSYFIPANIHHSFELKFRFVPNTMDQIALLAFIGQDYQHDSITDHLAVSFIKGYVVLTWNLGSGGYFLL